MKHTSVNALKKALLLVRHEHIFKTVALIASNAIRRVHLAVSWGHTGPLLQSPILLEVSEHASSDDAHTEYHGVLRCPIWGGVTRSNERLREACLV